jgi:hypothetical protein
MTFFGPPPSDTLAEARKALMEKGRWEAGGVRCPCCDGRAKVYKDKLNGAMARALLLFARHVTRGGDRGSWFHAVNVMRGAKAFAGHYGFLVDFGLLERKAEVAADGNSLGLFRLTTKAWDFIAGRARAPAYVIHYNDSCLRVSDETVSITDILGDGFDFGQVMDGVDP